MIKIKDELLFLYDYEERVLQRRHMYDSMDSKYIKQKLKEKIKNIKFYTYNDIRNEIGVKNIEGCVIIYTTSQMFSYKKYIEETMLMLDKKNVLIPNINILFSHENKSYEELYLEMCDIKTNIQTWTFGDLNSFKNTKFNYPIVIKMTSGSMSTGVKFCKNEREAIRFIKRKTKGDVIWEILSVPLRHCVFHFSELKKQRRFIVQEKIDNSKGEWRIEWHSGRILGFYRELKKNKQYASGYSIRNLYDIPEKILDYIEETAIKLGSPHIIFDIIMNDFGEIYLIEFSGIHIGQSSLLEIENNRYYEKNAANWEKVKFTRHEKIAEDFFVFDVVQAYELLISTKYENDTYKT